MARAEGGIKLWASVTGFDELDQALQQITNEDGPKSVNAEMRKACRAAVTEIVKPEVLKRVPWDEGDLESAITVRAGKRSRGKISYWVGFPDPLFQGDTFYGGFIEFGWDHYKGVHVEADSFLRSALYENADQVIARVRERMEAWVAAANSKA